MNTEHAAMTETAKGQMESAGPRPLATSVFRNAHLHRYSERTDAEIMLAWSLAMIRGALPADILRTIERFAK